MTRKNPLRGFCLAPPGGVCVKIPKCDEMTKWRNYENTEGTTDIGDYVNSILDFWLKDAESTKKFFFHWQNSPEIHHLDKSNL